MKNQKSLSFLLFLFVSFIAFNSQSQIIVSIGNPVNGLEGSTDVTYDIFIEGGGVNTTGAPITGNIVYMGTATSAADYIEVTTFSIPDGANMVTVVVTVLNDMLIECDESLIATITNTNVGSIGSATANAIIEDDDCFSLDISIGSPTDGEESVSDVSFVVYLENGAVNTSGAPIVGSINFTGSSDPSDFSSLPSTFSILPGESADTIVLNVVDDMCIELTETVIATISNPSIGAINNASSTADLFDNDAASAMVSIGNAVDGYEGGPTDVSFTISLDNGLTNCTGSPITGSINFAGSATPASDFSNLNTFSIPTGVGSITHTLTVIDDGLDECDESVIATLSNLNVGSVNPAASMDTAYIIDDECTNSLDELNEVGLTVYPNPASHFVSFEAKQQMSSYTIVDVHGRIMDAGKIDGIKHQIALDFLSKGTYFVEIHFENGTSINRKVVKK